MDRRRFCRSAIGAAVAAALPAGRAYASYLQALTTVAGDIDAVTGDGAERILKQAEVQELSDSLRGRLLLPGYDGYDTARHVLNGAIDRYPALVVQPSGAADVRQAVAFARENNLLTAVKGGGHSAPGKSTCDGGIQIDLSNYRNVEVDRSAQIAKVAGGSLLGDMDHETMSHGLVTTAGTVSHTGVGGLTLGGGFGRLGRRFGLAADNVMAVDIVTADGQLRYASAKEHPDLYWGVRGGGGNFGVVTSFEFKLHPMQRSVIGGVILFPIAQARDVLKFYAEYSAEVPDDFHLDAGLKSAPGVEQDFVMMHVCYSGPEENADNLLEPIRKAGTPIIDGIKAIDYVAIQRSGDNSDPRATGNYIKSGFLTGISDELIDSIVTGFEAHSQRTTQIRIVHCGGAIGRVPTDATAFAHRYATHAVFTTTSWPAKDDREMHVSYLRDYWSTIEPLTQGVYVNDLYDESQEFVNQNYQGNYDRLVKVKNKYDPGNLFRLNANVVPTV